jgi:S-adenosylmethionine:tRNA ribosyltransferase-isomerase
VKLSDFYFDLPENLIAQYPPVRRDQSRLMVLDRSSGRREHHGVADLPGLLEPGSLLVFNNSRVRKARLSGRALDTGAEVEFLLVEKLRPESIAASGPAGQSGAAERSGASEAGPGAEGLLWRAMVRRARRRRPGRRYVFAAGEAGQAGSDAREAEITAEDGEFRILCFDRPIDDDWLDRHGHIPLPPYIRRQAGALDGERYQTIYARETGSAAAPTAGLHFSPELLRSLEETGIESAFITLHVGLGTFLPVRTENIEDHRMHREIYTISAEAASRIERARAEGRKIVAVGTTSVRTLESAWQISAGLKPRGGDDSRREPWPPGTLARGEGSTGIFIYPGYRFQVVDQLFTNFHTPGSSLLMLVSAFAEADAGAFAGDLANASTGAGGPPGGTVRGRELILESYAEAIREGYRFFSYGDAMLIR